MPLRKPTSPTKKIEKPTTASRKAQTTLELEAELERKRKERDKAVNNSRTR